MRTSSCMARKLIAAFLLLAVSAWAEMTMAPMFAMHSGYMSSGHKMASDAPSAHHHSTPGQEMAAGHACCPALRKSESKPVLELVSGNASCDDPHRCCFRQGPQSVPSPARDLRNLMPDVAPVELARANPVPEASRFTRHTTLQLSPPSEVLGMTLRV